jgi:hypothetical protein
MAFADDLAAQQATVYRIEQQADYFLNSLLNVTNVSFGDGFNVDDALPYGLSMDGIQAVNFTPQTVASAPSVSIISAAPPTAPDLSFSTITDVAVPDLTATAPTLAFPTVPSNTLPTAPGEAPTFVSPDMPSAPTTTLPAVPTFESLAIPEPPAITLPTFSALAPIDDLIAPTAEFAFHEAAYESTLLDPLKAKLLTDLVNGGYGIEPADEAALFNRFRDREVESLMARIDDAGRTAASRGFPLPPGELSIHVDRAYQEMQGKVSGASREILLERSKLYVDNRQFTIREVKDLEQVLLNFHNAVQERALNVARLTVEMSIAVFRSLIDRYNARLGAYKVEAEVFADRIRAELAKAEIYKTQIDAVNVSSQIQRNRVDLYLAQLKGVETTVDIYKVRMEAARIQADVSRMALEAFNSRVTAYTAQVQAKVAEFGMYRSQIEGETAKVQAFDTQVKAYLGQVQGAKIRSDVQLGKLQAEAEQARARIAVYQGQLDQYKADVQRQVESGRLQVEVFNSQIGQSRMLNDGNIAKAGLEQAAYRNATEWNIKALDVNVARARAKLDAAVAALKFKTEGVHYANDKINAILTQLMGTINTLSVSTQ